MILSHFPHSNLDIFISSFFHFRIPHRFGSSRISLSFSRFSRISLLSEKWKGYRYILVWCLRFPRCASEQKSSAASSSASNLCGCNKKLLNLPPNNSFHRVHPIFNTQNNCFISSHFMSKIMVSVMGT